MSSGTALRRVPLGWGDGRTYPDGATASWRFSRRTECSAPAEPIDAVVTWVDGDDPVHRAKRAAWLGELERTAAAARPDRFREIGEFAYCIASLLCFAPWLRRIHIVTDGQTPAFLPAVRQAGGGPEVTVVDHRELFRGFEEHLPTFNNRSLLTAAWRIEGLAERFIYLNDDFVLLRPLSPTDFFRGERAVLRGGWHWQPWWHRLRPRAGFGAVCRRPGYHEAQALAAERAGYEWRYFRTPHAPHAQLRSLHSGFYSRNPRAFVENLRHRLRSPAQFLGDALCNHLVLRQGRAVVDNSLRPLRLKESHYRSRWLAPRLALAARDPRTAFACLQSLESASDEVRAVVFRWLEDRIGRPESVFGERGASGIRGWGFAVQHESR